MFHKEGHKIILFFLVAVIADILLLEYIFDDGHLKIILQSISIIVLLLILQFFRNPIRNTIINDKHIISPVDGKVVNIEKVYEKEYFKDERLQVSIFMSPIDVHVTRYPICGKVIFSKYHPGKYLVAWHPKSSTENERTTIVIDGKNNSRILYRQIAGAVARRICNYAKENTEVNQSKEAGFIKFGSRIDVFVPKDSKINVKIGDTIIGCKTILAHLN